MIKKEQISSSPELVEGLCSTLHAPFMHHLYEEAAEDACGERAEEDGYLATCAKVLDEVRVVAEREGVDEDAHGEADTAEAGYGEEHGPGGTFRHFAYLTLDGDEAGEGDADGFA